MIAPNQTAHTLIDEGAIVAHCPCCDARQAKPEALRVIICLWPLKRIVADSCWPRRLVCIRTASGEPAFVALVDAALWRDLQCGLPLELAGLVLADVEAIRRDCSDRPSR